MIVRKILTHNKWRKINFRSPLLTLIVLVSTSASAILHASTIIQESEEIITQFQSELKLHLTTAIKEGGAEHAIEVCSEKAPDITARLSDEYGVLLQRVSDKNRNSKARAIGTQKDALEYFSKAPFDSDIYYKEINNVKSIYAKAIKMDGVCLACHGEHISEGVTQRLNKFYPDDLAIGYKLGELRGIFSIERDLDESTAIGIKNFKILKPDLWVGGPPRLEQLEKLKSMGLKAIIDLLPEDDTTLREKQYAIKNGISYNKISVANANDITFENSTALDVALANTEGPVFLHCASSNRVGALLALRAYQNGADIEASMFTGRSAGLTSLEKRVRALLEKAEIEAK